jgi:hypothetical protein
MIASTAIIMTTTANQAFAVGSKNGENNVIAKGHYECYGKGNNEGGGIPDC